MSRGSVCFMVGERVIADGELGDLLVPSVGQTIEISGPPGLADNGEYVVEDVTHRLVWSMHGGARSTVFVQLAPGSAP